MVIIFPARGEASGKSGGFPQIQPRFIFYLLLVRHLFLFLFFSLLLYYHFHYYALFTSHIV